MVNWGWSSESFCFASGLRGFEIHLFSLFSGTRRAFFHVKWKLRRPTTIRLEDLGLEEMQLRLQDLQKPFCAW